MEDDNNRAPESLVSPKRSNRRAFIKSSISVAGGVVLGGEYVKPSLRSVSVNTNLAQAYGTPPPPPPQQPPAPFFVDEFDGTSIDGTKWDTTIAISGARLCGNGLRLSDGGRWIDVSTNACHGNLEPSLYGSVTVSNGSATFSAPYGRVFPFVWRGLPSKASPFPALGDFALEIRIRYDSIVDNGTGVWASFSPNTDPTGSYPDLQTGQTVFYVWADSGLGTRISLLGTEVPVPMALGTFHLFRLRCIGSAYSLSMDGVLVAGPTTSSLRPNLVWVGNPGVTYWQAYDWTDFTLDFVRVT
jgi:hypothetical protein